ncbi:hypothetical protein ACFY8B_36835, partial [Streptomyces sp. NPDC012751]|uniref:scabin-related ADP-ribosyltransferase n=1 Tax=Streptomyces sp. NPDC012751 TaxID=3364846 RepID=UPI00367B7B2A
MDYSMVHPDDRDHVVESDREELLWRFSDRRPEEVFTEGFEADATWARVSLSQWTAMNPAAPYVSTTRNSVLWHDGKRYRYEIVPAANPDQTGVDVIATLERRGLAVSHPEEEEVAFTGSISPDAVALVYDRDLNRSGMWDGRRVVWQSGEYTQATEVIPEGTSDADAQPAVDYSMVHPADRGAVVESRPGETVWRFSDKRPETVFSTGFRAEDPEALVRLRRWVDDNPPASYVSTTRDRAIRYMGRRFRYEIVSSLNSDPTGVDVNATLRKTEGIPEYREEEQEVAFTGSIDPRAVVRVYDFFERQTGTRDPATGGIVWTRGDTTAAADAQRGADVAPALTADASRDAGTAFSRAATVDRTSFGPVLGRGEVNSERWLPFGSRTGPDGQDEAGAFRFATSRPGDRPVVSRPAGSGERTEVGYDWVWHAG